MIGRVRASQTDIYEAVLALSRYIAGRNDLESLLSGVSIALKRVVDFEYLGMMLHQAEAGHMRLFGLSSAGPMGICEDKVFALDKDPAGWVWINQAPLVISSIKHEARWPEFMQFAGDGGIQAMIMVPLTAGDNRLGVLGFGCLDPYSPNPAELAFLERVAGEFAVAVDAHLAKQKLVHERDRVCALFDITNALVSKLSPDELFASISAQLSKIVGHDIAVITLLNSKTGGLDLYALHFPGEIRFELTETSGSLEGTPAAEAIATGKPVVLYANDLERFNATPSYQKFKSFGFKSACSIPLVTPNRTLGSLGIGRTSSERWTEDDVDFLVQVARQIAIAVENSLSYRELTEMKERLATEKLYLEDEIRLDQNFGDMVGESPAFQSVSKSIQIVAPTDATVLILGETGTGKELVARAIHQNSGRAKGSFVKVNCAAIPANLLESELFGHERGAFTGAAAQKIGRFELANQGTLFLDEIGELPLELQPKLLRAIQDQEFERVGGNRTIRTDVRFVVATNRDLKAMVDADRFRADLYYRLHVFPLNVPPLRDRREDIPLLTRFFAQKHARRLGRKIETIPSPVMDALARYDWPGNIRELQNLIERSVILSTGTILTMSIPEINGPLSKAPSVRDSGSHDSGERQRILKALKEANGQVGGSIGAAARLGLKRTTLQSRMRKLKIARQYS